MKKCPVCGVMMGDNVARCSMCKYDFQKASGGETDAAVAEAKKVLDAKEEENIARTEARRSEEEKHLAEIREKLNREMSTLTAQFESEKLRLDSEYAALQKQAIDEKLKLDAELEEKRAQVEEERKKIMIARSEGEKAKNEKIAEGQAKYDEMVALAASEQQRMIEETQKEIQEAASKIDAEYAEVLQKRDQLVAEATEAQQFLEQADALKKELEAQRAEQDTVIAAKKQEIAETEAAITKLQQDFEIEKERLEKEGRAIAEQQAGEALKVKEAAEAELLQLNSQKGTIIAEIEAKQQQAEAEINEIRVQAEQVIAEAEEAAKQRDAIYTEIGQQQQQMEALANEAREVVAQKEALDQRIAAEEAEIAQKKSEFESQIAEYEQQINDWTSQCDAIKGEYEEAQRVIADSKTATVQAQAVAEEIVLEAEKHAVFLKEVALGESEKGKLLNEIKEKEQIIADMEKERDELAAKIQSLEESIAVIERKAAAGGFGGGDNGPKEYCVDVVNHNGASEVDDKGIAKVLATRSADGWKLTSIINDDGGKLQSSMTGNDNSTGSLAMGAFSSKEDRVILIFERSKQA